MADKREWKTMPTSEGWWWVRNGTNNGSKFVVRVIKTASAPVVFVEEDHFLIELPNRMHVTFFNFGRLYWGGKVFQKIKPSDD